jgi:heat shock protein HslJ
MKKLLFATIFILISVKLVWSSISNESDTLLNHQWVLQKLNGIDMVKEKAGKIIPNLEFHLKDSSITGNTSCNDIYGKVIITGDEITFSEMSMTKMFCTDAQYEQDIENVLFNKGAYKYKIDNGILSLIKDGSNVMILKKTE